VKTPTAYTVFVAIMIFKVGFYLAPFLISRNSAYPSLRSSKVDDFYLV